VRELLLRHSELLSERADETASALRHAGHAATDVPRAAPEPAPVDAATAAARRQKAGAPTRSRRASCRVSLPPLWRAP
jgi:hypothetical protein